MTAEAIRQRIEASIPGARAWVEGGEAHFSAVVIASEFEGRTRIERHQMVYALFRDEMASQAIHALALRTLTPEERDKARQPMEIGT